ncbi:hypothetical protein [Prauserella alba]|uniref:Rho termination factor, N-terminal domain n=1 Tax=Prauserella alba TaxID=176898 RepID=A0ABP4GD08_9PSEU|nr:hypothetical protein [Prauserella alba]MCP2180726.1 hypothetical protein [Prauserella alba]
MSRFGNHDAGYLPNMVHIPEQQDNDNANTAELAESARALGIFATAHMSKAELIEAIRQQRETNAVLRADPQCTDEPDAGRRHPEEEPSGQTRGGQRRTGKRPGGVTDQRTTRRLTGGVTG